MSDFLSTLMKGINAFQYQTILDALPGPGDKRKGLTRAQIARKTGVSPENVSKYLQTLKHRHAVKCLYGKWRKNQKLSLTF